MTPTDLDTNREAERPRGGGDQSRFASATDKVRRSASDAYENARERTNAIYGSARQRASSAYDGTREAADRARRRAADSFDANPMSAVIGGLAIGVVAAALLPRTRRET